MSKPPNKQTQPGLGLGGDAAGEKRELVTVPDRSQLPVEDLPIVSSEQAEELAKAQDLRAALVNLPVEQANQVLAEYKARRDNFRDWLRDQLVEGVHFGYAPGTEPKYDDRGNLVSRYWSKKDNGYKETKIAPHQWTAKPSLYKAGADFICDLLAARDEYRADQDGWTQLGAKAGMFVYACYLKSRATGELLGEGRGVREVGQKGGDANNAIKMAKKSAKVDAVLNTWGLADLFTQDIEDQASGPPAHENTPRDPSAPKAQPRAQRQQAPTTPPVVTGDMLKAWFKAWCVERDISAPSEEDKRAFRMWCASQTGRDFQYGVPNLWTEADARKVCAALNLPWDEV